MPSPHHPLPHLRAYEWLGQYHHRSSLKLREFPHNPPFIQLTNPNWKTIPLHHKEWRISKRKTWSCYLKWLQSPWGEYLEASTKLDPKWVPERAKHSGRKIWHEMKGPWRLSPIEHNPKITNLFSRRAFLVTPRWWRSTWRFPITDHSWNVDIHVRKSKRGRRANQVKSNNSRQISQVK